MDLLQGTPLSRKYFETRFAISDRRDAELLQNRNNWQIVQALIDAGSRGLTSNELSKKLGISYKIVAESTKHLKQMDWITSDPPKPEMRKMGRPKANEKREFKKPAYLHVWDFMDFFEPMLEGKFEGYCSSIFEKYSKDFQGFLHALDLMIQEIKSSKEFYPTEEIRDDGWSHEGYEFIKGLLYAFSNWLEKNVEFQTILKRLNLATDEAFKEEG